MRLKKRVPFLQSLDILAKDGSIEYKHGRIACENSSEDAVFEAILEESTRYYHGLLEHYSEEYLIQRGLRSRPNDNLFFGYAGGGLKRFLVNERNFTTDSGLKCGVFKDLLNGTITDYFEDIIVFPKPHRGSDRWDYRDKL